MGAPALHKSILQTPEGGAVRCLTCERRCKLLPGGEGWCQTRFSLDGTIFTRIYGAVSSLSANPIEKKPLYHFYPGSRALTAGSWSCNFGCPWCQNWEISRRVCLEEGHFIPPEDFVQRALAWGCQGTSISFNEPTLSLEWSLDIFRLAKDYGLYNTYVTNGYMSDQALDLLATAGLDALNVDIKGSGTAVANYCQAVDVEKVWARCRQARALGLHLEVTTLVIPGVNDSDNCLKQIAGRIANELGAHTPWHVSRYHPAYRFRVAPTPIYSLERAWQIGRESGLRFVYLGNLPGHAHDDTRCPECNQVLIRRLGFELTHYALSAGSCPQCGAEIPGVGWDWLGS